MKITFDPPIRTTWESNPKTRTARFSTLKMFTHGIPTLAPGKEIRMFFEHGEELYNDEAMPLQYRVTADYEGERGAKREPEETLLDLEIFKEVLQTKRLTIHHAATELGKIRQLMEGQVGGTAALPDMAKLMDKARSAGVDISAVDDRRPDDITT